MIRETLEMSRLHELELYSQKVKFPTRFLAFKVARQIHVSRVDVRLNSCKRFSNFDRSYVCVLELKRATTVVSWRIQAKGLFMVHCQPIHENWNNAKRNYFWQHFRLGIKERWLANTESSTGQAHFANGPSMQTHEPQFYMVMNPYNCCLKVRGCRNGWIKFLGNNRVRFTSSTGLLQCMWDLNNNEITSIEILYYQIILNARTNALCFMWISPLDFCSVPYFFSKISAE